jgi:DNA helicase-2/ATP-dependent DNA helicase PcrA
MEDVLVSLNPKQKQAVETVSGPVLVLAGPGSGKTRVITHRIAYLVKICGVSPNRIMAVTFTNKAAREMMDRVERLLHSSIKRLTIGTFHAVCARILRNDGKAIGIKPDFVIYDNDDQQNLIKRAIEDIGHNPKTYTPSIILNRISDAKSRIVEPNSYLKTARSFFEEITAKIYERYQVLLDHSHAVDFDDLLLKTVQLFQRAPNVLSKYQNRYLHIMVDEFQDTNLVQYRLVGMLSEKYRNICVVGDPDQSIYSWRSADLRNIINFEKDFAEARVILLERNYRSTRRILDTASAVISANKHRKPIKLWTEQSEGECAKLVEVYNEYEEAQFIAREVEKLSRQGFKLSDCAVMYRTNAQSRVLEEAFIRYGLAYKLIAATRFYERREVKDIIAYLRLIHNNSDTVSLNRVINIPPRGLGQKGLARLLALSQSKGMTLYQAIIDIAQTKDKIPLAPQTINAVIAFGRILKSLTQMKIASNIVELFDNVISQTGYREYILNNRDGEERWDNIMELRSLAQEYNIKAPSEGLSTFLEGISLVSDVDNLNESQSGITLITLHQAKGLEFPVVFIIGLEENLLPHFRSYDDPNQMEEERRLCYVGITRAKERLYLVRALRRSVMGQSTACEASRFLADIPSHLLGSEQERVKEEKPENWYERLWNKYDVPTIEMPLLKKGDYVVHPHFGQGKIIDYCQVGDDAEITVAFDEGSERRLLQSFARLQKAA